MQKLDVNGRIKQWFKVKESDKKGVKGLSKHNSDITLEFLKDYSLGLNTPKGFKGSREPATLLKLRSITLFLSKNFPNKQFEKITKQDLHKILDKMGSGEIMKTPNKKYRGVGDFVKNLKTFYGWLLRVGKIKEDVTIDLSQSAYKISKPSWVFLNNEQMKTLINQARGDYRALILFLYDSGIRPQEAYRIVVSDFEENFTILNIPETRENGDRVSKTFERTIKLKQCPSLLREYVKTNNLKDDDLLIQIKQPAFNKYLRTLAKKLFGTKLTKARASPDKMKLYDIRHLASIFWLDRYQRNQDLMYRMGWAREDKIYYYSEFLGRRDKIDDGDMLTLEDKTNLEKEVESLKTQQEKSFQMSAHFEKELGIALSSSKLVLQNLALLSEGKKPKEIPNELRKLLIPSKESAQILEGIKIK